MRFVIGCGVLLMSVNGWGWWALLGLIPIATAAGGFCPLDRLIHVDTPAWEEAHEGKHSDHSPGKH